MFFVAAKLFWGFCAPSHVIVWCSLLAAMLLLAGRRRAGTGFAVVGVLLLVAIGIVPSYHWLGRPLEYRYASLPPPSHADGILVLAGGAADKPRVVNAYILSRRYQGAKIVFSGGSGELLNNQPDVDAQQAGRLFSALGLDRSRLTLEGQSRNTYENFTFSQKLVNPLPGQSWILVTSASHMPRALEVANQVGWKMFPWPSDHISARHGLPGWFEIPSNLDAFDRLMREHVGLLAYRLSGRARPM